MTRRKEETLRWKEVDQNREVAQNPDIDRNQEVDQNRKIGQGHDTGRNPGRFQGQLNMLIMTFKDLDPEIKSCSNPKSKLEM